ncbi:protein phosphatase CheZ [Ferrimonas marina]|uniref:Protein phosphatase CheZ n=1 Tax=Ferrimonas marina TaxID=299255 RepID=A0A1M5YE94_9GAMM|nr:protein phosphatase CheZ [Ferrimonas marina]SHI10357.1 chemotaxis protein CheZ [Ferrimonas marina]
MTQQEALISIEDAKALVELLQAGQTEAANDIILQANHSTNQQLFDEVGKLTRQLHDALQDFQLDDRISELAKREIPDAKERLSYVIDMTEQAANRTMDAVEESLPLADALQAKVALVKPRFDQLMRRELELDQFKTLCHDVDALLAETGSDVDRLKELLNQVLMAQDFQDLTGQVIRKVIDLVREVELSLVHMLTMFGESTQTAKERDLTVAEGPVVAAANREEVVSGQDEVDDLLSSLGF